MLVYVIAAIGSLWGIFTLIGIREDDKYIQELFQSAKQAADKKITRESHDPE